MPTILRKDGFRFFFFSNEGNEPPHIHIDFAGAHAKFWLDSLGLAYSSGFSSKQLTEIRNLVAKYQELFKESWDEYFK